MNKLVAFLFIYLIVLTSYSVSQLYTFKNFNYKEGLTFNSINDIIQSQDGTIWLASKEGGITKFNGENFQELNFKNNNQLFQQVISISQSSKNQIYFATRNSGIFRIGNNGPELIYQNKRQSTQYEAVYALDNSMLFVLKNSFIIYKNDKIVFQKRFSNKHEEISCYDFIPTLKGFILLTNIGGFHISSETNEILSLEEFSGLTLATTYKNGFSKNNILYLFDKRLEHYIQIKLNNNGNYVTSNRINTNSPLWDNDNINTGVYSKKRNEYFLLSQNGILYNFDNGSFKEVLSNTNEKPINCHKIIADYYGDLWLCSKNRGLYKISIEPFTKVDLNSIYSSSLISLFHITKEGRTIVGNDEGQTHISKGKSKTEFATFNFHTNCATEFKDQLYLGTNSGVKILDTKTNIIKDLEISALKNKTIHFIFADPKTIWIALKNEGVLRYNPETKEINWFQNLYTNFPSNFQTAQKSADGSYLLFGSETGLHKFDLNAKTFKAVTDIPKNIGINCKLSTIDSFGTRWYLFEKGLLGVTKNNRKRVIQDPSNFKSFDFRTFTSDKNGNLIIGSNKGISLININALGNVQHVKFYDQRLGFEGFDIKENVQFTKGNLVYLETIEGLYQINSYNAYPLLSPLERK